VTDPNVERIGLEEIPLTLVVNYHDLPQHPADLFHEIVVQPGIDPFILMRMQQVDGSVQCQIEASQIPGEDDLIETLEVFLTALVEDRSARRQAMVCQCEHPCEECGEGCHRG
jgi:hypothetical protein